MAEANSAGGTGDPEATFEPVLLSSLLMVQPAEVADVLSPRVACEGPAKPRFSSDFCPLHGRRDPWKEARPAGAWMPDALFGQLATRCLRRSPSGPQAAGLIPSLVRRVAVDSRQKARGAWRAMRGKS